jgi:gamma-tubulin complex component 2
MIAHLEAIHAKDGSGHAQAAAAAAPASAGPPLKGIEVFMVDYKVAWPVSLVVSKRSVTKYQLVFRHLFFARHVERCLKQTWQGQQRLKELDVRAAGGRSYCLRHRMLGFMQDIVYYFTYEVGGGAF